MGRAVRLGWLTLLAVATLAACTSEGMSGTISGIVLSVEGDLEEVTSFTVLADGEQVTFVPAEDGDFAFPLSHLKEHQRSGDPVIVGWELVDGTQVAVSIDDG